MRFDADVINAIADKVVQILKPELVGQIRHHTDVGPKGYEGGYYEMICPACKCYLTLMDSEIEKADRKEREERGW